MKKFILFFLIFNATVYGYAYNETLIRAQIAVYPKILLLDKQHDEKLVEDKIVFIIAHEEKDYIVATNIKSLMIGQYGGLLSDHKFEIKTVVFSKLSQNTQATAIYALNSTTHMLDLSKIAAVKRIVTFVYNIAYLKDGIMFSLVLEKNTALYLNKKNLNKDTINFVDSLYEIVKFTNLD